EVFRVPASGETPDNEVAGWIGGFDVVLGNPPWEMPEVDDRQFFWRRSKTLAQEPSAQKRARMIDGLAQEDPALLGQWREHCRKYEGERAFFSSSGVFPFGGRGRLNYCRLFIEQAWQVCNPRALVGLVVARGLARKEYDQPLWHYFLEERAVAHLYDFVNTEGLFPAVHDWQKFMALTLNRLRLENISTACWLTNPSQIAERAVVVPLAELDVFSPGTRTLPQSTSPKDLELLRAAHSRFLPLAAQSEWGYLPRLMFSSSDKGFRPVSNSEAGEWTAVLPNRRKAQDGPVFVPVYEGKMIGVYDHRQADIYLNPANPSRQAQERVVPQCDKTDPYRFATPQ